MHRHTLPLVALLAAIACLPRPLWAMPEEPWFPKAPRLPAPTGRTVAVADVDQLYRAAQQAQPGDTILVADGHYRMPGLLQIRSDNVTLRSASGDRHGVVFDAAGSGHGELLGLFDCSGVTIADLTLQNVQWNALKINSDHGRGVHRVTVHNCVFRNVWQRAIKSVQIRQPHQAPQKVVVRYCLFVNDRPKQFADDPADKPGQHFDGNYVGGIDAMHARNWTIANNVFMGIRGRTGSGRAAIFLWVDSRDSVIERNIIVDCDRGIELGNAYIHPHIEVHCSRITVRHNQITRAPVGAVTATHTRDCRLEHNAICDPENRFRRSIRMVRNNPGLVVAHNVIAGPPPQIESEDKTQVLLRENQHGVALSLFRDPEAGDLRLGGDVPQGHAKE